MPLSFISYTFLEEFSLIQNGQSDLVCILFKGNFYGICQKDIVSFMMVIHSKFQGFSIVQKQAALTVFVPYRYCLILRLH